MTAYVDASVILRLALGQPNGWAEWPKIRRGVSSALITTESLRTLDRLRLRAKLSDVEVATRRATILSLIDALHLATALLWKDMAGTPITMATHDEALGLNAKAHGLSVVGAAK